MSLHFSDVRKFDDDELIRQIRMAENTLGVLRTEWFTRNGKWPPVSWIGGDNPTSEDDTKTGMNPVIRKREFGI